MARTTDQTATDDPILGLIAKRKSEALARAEKEHNQLAAAARLYAQGTKTVNDAEEQLRKGREKQDNAIAAMLAVGMDNATVAETLGIAPKAVSEAAKRHRSATGEAAPASAPARKAAAGRGGRAKAADADGQHESRPASAADAPDAAATTTRGRPAAADGGEPSANGPEPEPGTAA
jgi:hypothetical protein